MARVKRKTYLSSNENGPPASSKGKTRSRTRKKQSKRSAGKSDGLGKDGRETADRSPIVGSGGGWRHKDENAPAASELAVIRKAKEMGRAALPDAVQVFVNGLADENRWIQMVAARELLSRFGVPVMAQLKQTVEIAAAPRRLYGFQDPFIEAGVIDADYEQIGEPDTSPKLSSSTEDDDDAATT